MIQTEVDRISKEAEAKMKGAIEAIQKQFATIRTGRAHPSLVEAIKVDYYGTKTPLKQLANITAPEPRLLVVQPWDKGSVDAIVKAIMTSDVGIAPQSDGKVLRLSMPQLTRERCDELTKVLHRIAEESRVSVRNARHHAIEESHKLEKDKKITEDDSKTGTKKVQELTDEFVKKLDELLKHKEAEIT